MYALFYQCPVSILTALRSHGGGSLVPTVTSRLPFAVDLCSSIDSKVRFSLQVTLFMNSPQQHPCVMNDIRMGLNGCCWVFVYVRHAKILTHCERRRWNKSIARRGSRLLCVLCSIRFFWHTMKYQMPHTLHYTTVADSAYTVVTHRLGRCFADADTHFSH